VGFRVATDARVARVAANRTAFDRNVYRTTACDRSRHMFRGHGRAASSHRRPGLAEPTDRLRRGGSEPGGTALGRLPGHTLRSACSRHHGERDAARHGDDALHGRTGHDRERSSGDRHDQRRLCGHRGLGARRADCQGRRPRRPRFAAEPGGPRLVPGRGGGGGMARGQSRCLRPCARRLDATLGRRFIRLSVGPRRRWGWRESRRCGKKTAGHRAGELGRLCHQPQAYALRSVQRSLRRAAEAEE